MADKLRYRKNQGACTEMFRGLLMLINVVMALGSLAVIGIAGWVQAKSTQSLTDVCHTCNVIVVFAIALFCTLFIFSLIGFRALYSRNRCLLLIYGFYLCVFFICALGITIVFVLVRSGHFDGRLQQAWNTAVKETPQELCSLQQDVQCSGWTTACVENTTTVAPTPAPNTTEAPAPNGTTTTLAPNETTIAPNTTIAPTPVPTTMAPASAICAVCEATAQVTINTFNQTCFTALTNSMNTWYQPVIICGFTLVGLALISIITACKVRKQDEEDEEEGGMYTRM